MYYLLFHIVLVNILQLQIEKGKDNAYYFPGSLKLDHDACANINRMLLIPCCGELRELRSGHYHKMVEISEHSGKCFEEEYTVGCIDIGCKTSRYMMFFF